jgi:hypothetical protein
MEEKLKQVQPLLLDLVSSLSAYPKKTPGMDLLIKFVDR